MGMKNKGTGMQLSDLQMIAEVCTKLMWPRSEVSSEYLVLIAIYLLSVRAPHANLRVPLLEKKDSVETE